MATAAPAMDLINLSEDPALPCFVLRLARVTILFDCPLDQGKSATKHKRPANLTCLHSTGREITTAHSWFGGLGFWGLYMVM